MRFMFIMRKIFSASMAVILAFVFTGCAPIQIQKVTAHSADSYKFSLEKDGFKISVDPYREKDRLRDSFGCDLISRGILPVLVVIEDKNAEDGYVLMLEKANLVLKEVSATGQKTSGTPGSSQAYEMEQAKRRAQMTNGILLPASPIFGLLGFAVALPFGIAADKKYSDETKIQRNLEEKQIVTKTLYPGSSQNGFFYFNLGMNVGIDRVEGISLILKNIRTEQELSFIVKIEQMQ